MSQACVREDALMMKPVATFVTLLMALMPAAAAPIPAVKSAQCPPGHMVSGGFCAPLFRVPPVAVPKVMHCPNRLMQRGHQLLPRNAAALVLRGPREARSDALRSRVVQW